MRTLGATGRVKCGAPARYIGANLGLFVSAMDNTLGVDTWSHEDETSLPVPTDRDVSLARTIVRAVKQEFAVNPRPLP